MPSFDSGFYPGEVSPNCSPGAQPPRRLESLSGTIVAIKSTDLPLTLTLI